MRLFHYCLLIALLQPSLLVADEVRLAVASNFLTPIETLRPVFERTSGHRLLVSSGSTGKFYAQIRHGAPYDLFLAADSDRPRRLVEEGFADPQSRFTYAYGILALWEPGGRDGTCLARLKAGRYTHLAIANPKVAPYGRAAQELLTRMGLWQGVSTKLVRGENIAQALQFVERGGAEMGLVALSLVAGRETEGCLHPFDGGGHAPLAQQVVALKRAGPAAHAFLDFLKGREAQALIAAAGYRVETE